MARDREGLVKFTGGPQTMGTLSQHRPRPFSLSNKFGSQAPDFLNQSEWAEMLEAKRMMVARGALFHERPAVKQLATALPKSVSHERNSHNCGNWSEISSNLGSVPVRSAKRWIWKMREKAGKLPFVELSPYHLCIKRSFHEIRNLRIKLPISAFLAYIDAKFWNVLGQWKFFRNGVVYEVHLRKKLMSTSNSAL